jgi:hypothetical protein
MSSKTKFNLQLHYKDKVLIERLQLFFGVGSIFKVRDSVRLRVQSVEELSKVIIPHF